MPGFGHAAKMPDNHRGISPRRAAAPLFRGLGFGKPTPDPIWLPHGYCITGWAGLSFARGYPARDGEIWESVELAVQRCIISLALAVKSASPIPQSVQFT